MWINENAGKSQKGETAMFFGGWGGWLNDEKCVF
jgi:hypothetical protein